MEDQAVHIVGQIGEGDPGLGTLDADGTDEQPLLVLLMGEHVLDAGARLRLGCVALTDMLRH